MTATQKNYELLRRLARVAPNATVADAELLRKAELTLHRWDEAECGDSNDYCSRCIERDEETGKPFMTVIYHNETKARRIPIADREAGALRRVAALCKRLGLHYYHQGDCRGCALYVDCEPLPDNNYTKGIACCER